MKSVFFSALHKSSGKTMLALGLSRVLTSRKLKVQLFKKGPDYIDPMWLSLASRRPCCNLDFHTMSHKIISSTYRDTAKNADFAIIEGNKGLFDGIDLYGSDSNAALVKVLKTPVVIIVDTRGMTRGVAPVLLGYQAFDKDIKIAGVILNQVGGSRHESKLRSSIEYYTDIPVLGAIGQYKEMAISERHLGLIPVNENCNADDSITEIAKIIENNVDIDHFQRISTSLEVKSLKSKIRPIPSPDVRIAIALDTAFGFYYPDDLKAFEKAGAKLIPFNTFTDKSLPDADGLFIGGGFPETQSSMLESNKALREDIRKRITLGMPAYAECGGLIYLAQDLTWQGITHKMAGVIPGNIVIHEKPIGRGYVHLRETENNPWKNINFRNKEKELPAHEFHYASIENLPAKTIFAYKITRGYGINGQYDGIVIKNLLANFSHQRNIGDNKWVERFTSFVRNNKKL
ncbi:MAG: cobyrinate a,c-diamide synthase [Pseudomonadota bacterium]|nr:cobyrinate a,c-diamide synthase [Pseudomonadota bacterium]